MNNELTVEQKAHEYDVWANMTNLEEFRDLFGRLKIKFTEHECMSTIQTGGTPVSETETVLGQKVKFTDIEQKQYQRFLMLSPCFGDSGNMFFYFDKDNKYVAHRVYANK